MSTHVFPIPDGDAILIERLPDGSQRISRLSGRPIGELIPIGMDPSAGLRELITVESTLAAPAAIAVHGETIDQAFPARERLSFLPEEIPTYAASTVNCADQSGEKL